MNDPLELIVTIIALVAVAVALIGITGLARPSVVARRLQILYALLAAFFAMRIGELLYPTTAFNGLILLIAAWLPFAQLRLGEDIVRHHAPQVVKTLTLGSAVVFTFLTLISGFIPSQSVLIALAIYQALAFASVVFVLNLYRKTVSAADRGLADTFVLALLIGVPLALTDFRELIADAPVRGGAFGMLVMVLATSHFASGTGTPRLLLKDICVSLMGGAILVLLMKLSGFGISFDNMVKLAACAVATTSLVILIERFTSGRKVGSGIIRALAQLPDTTSRTSLLSAHPLLSNGKLLEASALADYPDETVRVLLQHQVLTNQTGGPATRDAACDLLDRFAATHLMRMSTSPPQFLAIFAGELAGPSFDDDLIVTARLIEAAHDA